MTEPKTLLLGGADGRVELLANKANRHGLIAGATGTGKTVTLKVMAQEFSRLGVPVFVSDVKGDLSGLAIPGTAHPKIDERCNIIGIDDFAFEGSPVCFWDIYRKDGHPVRATIADVGPLLLARMLNLNDNQAGLLEIVFALADDQGLLLLDVPDLKALLSHVGENAKEISAEYGLVSKASLAAIQRKLLGLTRAGAKQLFGEPALELEDLMRCDDRGYGMVNILAGQKLILEPRLYSTMLMWLLSELFEELPEVGDPEVPRLVFFFDEAHLLFKDAPKSLVDKVEQVVRLIRSKGVGVYFVTQSPDDLPDAILAQLGNRVQHALRAGTPRQQKAIRAAAQSFVPNPKFKTETVIGELGVGEALVSVLNKKGAPEPVQRTLICPPRCAFKPAAAAMRKQIVTESVLADKYNEEIDRVSAHEKLQKRAEQRVVEAEKVPTSAQRAAAAPRRGRSRQSYGETLAKSALRSIGSKIGRELIRGIMGSFRRR